MPIMARTRAQNYDPYSDWQVGADGRTVNALGQHKIVGYSPDRTPSRGFGGIDEFNTRQNYGGTRQAIDNFVNDARKAGELVGKDGGRILDTWENRGFKTHLSDQNPYAAPAAPAAPDAVAAAGAGVNNKDFANQPAPKGAAPDPEVVPGQDENDSPGSDDEPNPQPEPVPEPDTQFSRLTKFANTIPVAAPADGTLKPPTPAQPLRSAASPYRDPDLPMNAGQIQSHILGTPPPTTTTPAAPLQSATGANNPYSRAGNVASAMADGSFEGIRDSYNRSNMERGYAMNGAGDIIENKDIQQDYNRSQLQPLADEIAAQRDFDRGEAPVMYDRPGNGVSQDGQGLMVPSPIRATKMNPYGTATATYGGLPNGGGTMKDPLTGNTVPIKQWTSDQSAVQATKYGPGAAQAGEDYFNPKKVAASTVPLGQADAEQYRAFARGGKIPRSSKA